MKTHGDVVPSLGPKTLRVLPISAGVRPHVCLGEPRLSRTVK
jgi:hypothetical protein